MTNSEKQRMDDSVFLSGDDEHIVKSLQMAIAQIDMSFDESSHSVDLALEALNEINSRLTRLKENLSECPDLVSEGMSENLDVAGQQLYAAIVAFQFFDRLSQRISHVKENLSSVSSLIQEPTLEHPSLWLKLQEKMRTVYSQDQESKLYHALSANKAGKAVQSDIESNAGPNHGSTELF